jgi:hypothetical protein
MLVPTLRHVAATVPFAYVSKMGRPRQIMFNKDWATMNFGPLRRLPRPKRFMVGTMMIRATYWPETNTKYPQTLPDATR